MGSPEAEALWEEFRQARDPSATFDLNREREGTVGAGDILPHPVGVTYVAETIADVPAIRAVPQDARAAGVVLWIHGGAFTMMSADTHKHLAGHAAAEVSLDVLIPDYSLAPEHPFPEALEEVCAVYGNLLDRGDQKRIFLVGDSAGAALAMGIQVRARDRGRQQPALTVLLCPWLDCTLRQPSLVANANLDVVLDAKFMREHVEAYLDGCDPAHPGVSPVYADLAGLGPLYIQAAEYDILVDDSVTLARLALEAGVDVELEIAPELPHCYQFFAGVIPEADAAITRVAAKVFEHIGAENSIRSRGTASA